jgi:hypothetical protein
MTDEEREERDTLPPPPDPELELFELYIHERGENDARLLQLEALLFGYERRSR